MNKVVGVIIAPTLAIASLNTEHFYSRIANKLRLFAINAIQYEEFETEFDSGISYAYQIRDELGALVNLGGMLWSSPKVNEREIYL